MHGQDMIADKVIDTFDESNAPTVTADFGALTCPLLGLKSMGLLRKLKRGQTAEITTDSKGSGNSLSRVAWMTKTQIVDSYDYNGRFRVLLRKA